MSTSDSAIRWLLSSADPSVRYITLTEVCGVSERSAQAARLRAAIPSSRRVRALLRGQRGDGGFGGHPYKKWDGAHWRLVSLVELRIPKRHPLAVRALDQVLGWLHSDGHRRSIMRLNGRVRRCASQEGNALRVASRLGLGEDERVRRLAHDLASWQWPDGGWNCDRRPGVDHSSFHESLIPLWALIEYREATTDRSVDEPIERAAEFFLHHRLFRSDHNGTIIHPSFLQLRYPPYWHYDVLTALRVMARIGKLGDRRAGEALDVIKAKRGRTGLWGASGRWWRPRGRASGAIEVVNWGSRGPNEMITLHALSVLRAAGRA